MKITFFRSALNSNNNLYKLPCGSFTYPKNSNINYATVDAINNFQKINKVKNWRESAEFYEISQ